MSKTMHVSLPSQRKASLPIVDEPMENMYDDDYIDVILKKNSYLIRSFALGGQPYFEKAGEYTEADQKVIDEICSGILNDGVKDLFDGAEIPKSKGIPANIFDSRSDQMMTYTQMLYPTTQSDKPIKMFPRRFSVPSR